MKLYINACINCNTKIYLTYNAHTRSGLMRQIGSEQFTLRCGTCGYFGGYSVGEVYAETDKNSTAAGAVVGGLVGLLGGPLGVLIGAGIGGALGGADDTEDQQKVDNFNNSWI